MLGHAKNFSSWEFVLIIGHRGLAGQQGAGCEFGSSEAGLEYRPIGAALMLRVDRDLVLSWLKALVCVSWPGWSIQDSVFAGAHLKPGAMEVGWHWGGLKAWVNGSLLVAWCHRSCLERWEPPGAAEVGWNSGGLRAWVWCTDLLRA